MDEHLSELLQRTLCGPVEAKLNLFGEILYEECSGRYRKVTIKKAVVRTKGRRKLMTWWQAESSFASAGGKQRSRKKMG